MKDVDQTNPYTGQPFGLALFGPEPVTDGGREGTGTGRMDEVDHESPNGGTNRCFQRGRGSDATGVRDE